MKSSKTNEKVANLAILLVALSGFIGIFSARSLYADGSFWFWWILKNENFFAYDSRIIAHLIYEAPVVIGTQIGISEVSILQILFGIGTIGVPTGLWIWALVNLKNDRIFWPFLATYAVVVFNSSFLSVGEYNLAFAIVALASSCLLRSAQTLTTDLLPAFLALFSFFTYESMVFFGPLLAVFSFLRVFPRKSHKSAPLRETFLFLSFILFQISAGISAYWILNPRDAANLNEAGKISTTFLSNPQLIISSVALMLYLLSWQNLFFRSKTWLIANAFLPLVLLWPLFWATPIQHYESRAICAFILFLSLVFLRVFSKESSRRRNNSGNSQPKVRKLVWIGAISLFVSLFIPMLVLNVNFGNWASKYEHFVHEGTGQISFEDAKEQFPEMDQFMWPWTNEFMSADLGAGSSGYFVLSPEGAPDIWGHLKEPLPGKYSHELPLVVWGSR